jgi:hypothetical protein
VLVLLLYHDIRHLLLVGARAHRWLHISITENLFLLPSIRLSRDEDIASEIYSRGDVHTYLRTDLKRPDS